MASDAEQIVGDDRPPPARPRRAALVAWLVACLADPRGQRFIVGLGVLAAASCLTVGFSTDDHMLRAKFLPDPGIEGLHRDRFDLFIFSRGQAQIDAFIDRGIFTWWTTPGYTLAFWRPLSSATHALDFALWPESSALMYAHSLGWYAALLLVLAALYRRLMPGWTGGLALLLYALDDAHGPTVGYISNRNALVMSTLAMAALWAHDRARRDGWGPGRLLSPLLMALGLLAGEGAVVGFGYLFAYAVLGERGPWAGRVRSLVPHVLVGAAWVLAYKGLGYGAHGSGIYLEPAGETLAYLKAALARVPVLLGAQLVGPWSDLWLVYPPGVAQGVLVLVLGLIALVGVAAWSVLRREPVARMWALGSLLACLPLAGTFPADRLLVFVGVGGAGLVAMVIDQRLGPGAPRAPWLPRLVAVGLVVIHGVLGPLLLPVRARSMETVARTFAPIDLALPPTPALREQTVVVVVTPNDGMTSYLPFMRAAEGQPAPRRLRVLASSMQAVSITRVDAQTLSIRPEGGFLATAPERMLRGPDHPFVAGDTVDMPGMRVIVDAITGDGRPAEVRFVFEPGLEDSSYRFLSWRGVGFEPWVLPGVGETVTVPAVDTDAMARHALGWE